MKINKNHLSKKSRVEMIPLIDCIFLLLVFFMYLLLSMVIHKGIPVDLPEAVSSELDKEKYYSISISKENQIYFNKDEVTLVELSSRLEGITGEGNKEPNVFINADKQSYYGTIIDVLDEIRDAGISKISFEVEMEEDSES